MQPKVTPNTKMNVEIWSWVELVSALNFGAIHRKIGIFDQCVSINSIIGIEADTYTDADSQFVFLQNKWQSESFVDLAGDAFSFVRSIEIRQKYDELISTPSGDSILITAATFL